MSQRSPNVPYNGGSLLGVAIAMAILQIVGVIARFYTRHSQRIAYALDDFLIVIALVRQLIASLGQSALYVVLVEVAGVGYPMSCVEQTPEKLVALEKGLYANEIIDFPFVITPAKISILVFYVRIFSTRNFKVAAYIVGAIVLGHGIGVLLAAIFQCWPIDYTWNKTTGIEGGSCFNQQAFYRYVSPPNILTDVLLLTLPLPYVWKLHTSRGHKLALTGVFLLGGLGTVASILRMTNFFEERATVDPTRTSTDLGIWTILEGALIIIAACLPPTWALKNRPVPTPETL
ncbi:hypothetical protein BO86DRAFT_308552 [Aspergillus japonicus CBS 114.51]|uniref:Rhodopsin domain-containing protein n=1 Tax=Aspergillus japonicus CBS 114.51 TaxID=1448312 RepID=A0A8T8X6V6_ASPJA|nr:hypothetical protein BO86DRAFT_308552 [Aspergillus japonicus CBS 114.51]RAH83873.1 hypothetical protein BO86DRAFT_308552 [Aspergillus japonicus CBS 114.51]